MFLRSNKINKDVNSILEIFGDVLYSYGLVGHKFSFLAGRYQLPISPSGQALLVGPWLKVPVDVKKLPPGVFIKDLMDERLITALRSALGRHVECRVSGPAQLLSSLTETPVSEFTAEQFWYFVEINDGSLRGIPRFLDFSSLPSPEQLSFKTLPIIFGISTAEKLIYFDLSELVAMLCCGSTRQGKSVFIRSILDYLSVHFPPSKFQALLGDFKYGVEFGKYSGLPHFTVFTNEMGSPMDILKLVENETEKRFSIIRGAGCRSILDFNQKVSESEQLPYYLIVVDEFAEFRLQNKKVMDLAETWASRSAGAGLYWFISTQRPSIDIVTGSLKANLASRVSFSLASVVDTKVVFDLELPEVVRVGCPGRGFAMVSDQFVEFQSPFTA